MYKLAIHPRVLGKTLLAPRFEEEFFFFARFSKRRPPWR